MTENKNLATVLELFHIARKETQIIGKLQDCLHSHNNTLRDISSVLCSYAPLKTGTILQLKSQCSSGDLPLYFVMRVNLSEPKFLDMKPEFNYELHLIKSVSSADYHIVDHTYECSISSRDKSIDKYRIVPAKELPELVKALGIKKLKNKVGS